MSSVPSNLPTPAFVIDLPRIHQALAALTELRRVSGCRVLFSIKALPLAPLIAQIAPHVDGFSVSSLFEARLAREALDTCPPRPRPATLHITTPGFRAEEIEELAALCDFLAFNSLEQLQRLGDLTQGRARLGLRVNPGLSSADDPRYDPCKPQSKLGVPLADLARFVDLKNRLAARISGIHFHTACESREFAPLAANLRVIEAGLDAAFLRNLEWINLGGGYLFESAADLAPLAEWVSELRERYGVAVYFEPGKAIVGPAGSLLTRVIDGFERDGQAIAVLDSGVHHLPEVFEYQRRSLLAEHDPDGAFSYRLVGSTCLAGDEFGVYRFVRPLAIGDVLTIEQVGAYSLIKASRFNGHNLPSIGFRQADGELQLSRQYDYADFRRQWA